MTNHNLHLHQLLLVPDHPSEVASPCSTIQSPCTPHKLTYHSWARWSHHPCRMGQPPYHKNAAHLQWKHIVLPCVLRRHPRLRTQDSQSKRRTCNHTASPHRALGKHPWQLHIESLPVPVSPERNLPIPALLEPLSRRMRTRKPCCLPHCLWWCSCTLQQGHSFRSHHHTSTWSQTLCRRTCTRHKQWRIPLHSYALPNSVSVDGLLGPLHSSPCTQSPLKATSLYSCQGEYLHAPQLELANHPESYR
mmetsp:Transcript_38505/g.88898  ORF Transcript_38505/g.88898 Transcript_38505/m.88898 type:complete len:248 (-) Transcript_38505:826-1569(-)